MNSIVTYKNDETIFENLDAWSYGNNWPVVYIYYNDKVAYVGETLDAFRRTEEHKEDNSFDEYEYICFISNKTFNKSVILDLEAFLIKYMGADGSKKLNNGNAGVVDHEFFYKELYQDDFKLIWKSLLDNGVVHKSLIDIENSELFKYSPYKALNVEQQKAARDILYHIGKINNPSTDSLIEVVGGAGTGKTILAVYLVKLLIDINSKKEIWKSVDNPIEAVSIQRLSKHLKGIREIGFVVPQEELRKTMKSIFKSINNLSPELIYAPEEVTHKYFDLLIVDEAHRLYKNKHLPQGAAKKFETTNKKLMGDSYTKSESDLTELDWIIQSSRLQVLFYDQRQTIRTPDIDRIRFDRICAPHLYKRIELTSQMRCKGGNDYYNYVKDVLTSTNLSALNYKRIKDYEIHIFDSIDGLIKLIEHQNSECGGLCKIATGPGWNIKEDILIENSNYHWYGSGLNNDFIFSIHKIQGFDLNYGGVIFGREIKYNKETKRIEVDKSLLKDNYVKSSGDRMMREYVLNIYLTLMTRGIKGTYIYVMDNDLKEYLSNFLL